MNDLAQEKLHEILKKNGRDVIRRPDLCEGLLRDYLPEQRLEVSVLVSALKEQIPAELLKPSSGVPRDVQLGLLARRLQDHAGLSEDASRWAVDAWAIALEQTPSSKRSSNLSPLPSPLPVPIPPHSDIIPPHPVPLPVPVPPPPRRDFKMVGVLLGVLLVAGLGYGGVKIWQSMHPPVVNHDDHNDNKDKDKNDNKGNDNQPKDQAKKDQVDHNDQNTKDQNKDNINKKNEKIPPHENVVNPPPAAGRTLPTGTALHVELSDEISSQTASVGDEFMTTVASDVKPEDAASAIIPKGADATLRVTAVQKAGHVAGSALLTVQLVQVSVHGKTYKVSAAPYSEKGKSRGATTAKRAGIAGAAGAAIGAIFGHKHKGADAAGGAAIGAGGAVAVDAVTEGEPVVFASGLSIPFHLTKPLTVE